MTTDSPPTAPGGYLLDNAWEHARHRLDLLEHTYDPATRRHLADIGVGPGWRCLEIGGGGGSIAALLADRVGPGGRVVATDLDPRFLQAAAVGRPNLEVLRHDVVAEPLPPGEFDLVHARAVLMHLPAREEVLGKLIAALAPGGWLLLEDGDRYGMDALSTGPLAELMPFLYQMQTLTGIDPEWGRRIPDRLVAGGLVDVEAEGRAPIIRGGSPEAEFLTVSFAQLAPQMAEAGAPEALMEAVYAELTDPGCWQAGWSLVTAWGRRPDPGGTAPASG